MTTNRTLNVFSASNSKGDSYLGEIDAVLRQLGKFETVDGALKMLGYKLDYGVKVWLKRRRSKRIFSSASYTENCIYINPAMNHPQFKRELTETILKAIGHFAYTPIGGDRLMLKGHSPKWKKVVRCFGVHRPKATSDYPELMHFMRHGVMPPPPNNRRAAIEATRIKMQG